MSRQPKKIPGIENRQRRHRDGSPYWTFRVRWKDPITGERRGEEFDTQADAIDFKAKLRLVKRSGRLDDLSAGRETLTEFVAEWWTVYAAVELDRSTLKTYASIWNRHLLPRLGHLQLRQIDPATIARLRASFEDDDVGAPTGRKAMSLLQGILARAIEWGRITGPNPVAAVRKPRVTRQLAVHPLTPVQVEALADTMPTEIDRLLVHVLAYSGPRPEDALALQWRHVRRDTILYEQKVVDGQVVAGQKTHGKAPRTVRLLPPLRADLAAYRLAQPTGVLDSAYIFARPDGQPWTEHDYRNWRRRIFQPAAAAAGLATIERTDQRIADPNGGPRRRRVTQRYTGPRPYDLRHSYVSLRIHEGQLSVAEIAAEVGNSPETLLSTYTHVFEELKNHPKIPAELQITKAREQRRKEAEAQ